MKIYFFSGELSADHYGAMLLRALKKIKPEMQIKGVGGPEMRAEGISGALQMEDFSVMGFTDVLKSIFRLVLQFKRVQKEILSLDPEVVVFIDSPSFSLRMAKALRKKSYRGKIVQYICPTVWAWGKERIKKLEKYFDLLLTIFPFESSFFVSSSLKVEYVGNPLKESIQNYDYDSFWEQSLGVQKKRHVVGLFPGSRKAEIIRNLPKQLEAAKKLKRDFSEISFVISCAQESYHKTIADLIQKSGLKRNEEIFLIPKKFSYDLMRSCQTAIAKSGTVTLELALHQRPTVVVYELTWLNRFFAKYVLRLRLPYYCIVNILANKEVFPELMEEPFTAQNVYLHLLRLHLEGKTRTQCLEGCREVNALLKEENASEKAAQAIAKLTSISARSLLS